MKRAPILVAGALSLTAALVTTPESAATAQFPDTVQVENPIVIVSVDDDSERGVRVYKGVNCTTPSGMPGPLVIPPGYTSEAWWREPISFRYYQDTHLTRYRIRDGVRIDPLIKLNATNHTSGHCYPKDGQRLTAGVHYHNFNAPGIV